MPTVANLVVKAVRKDKGGFKLDNDKWYSAATRGTKYMDLSNGDVVSFEYKENGDWNNITSDVVKGSSSGVAVGSARKNSAMDAGFPVPALHYSRSIIRQNSLGHAVDIVLAKYKEKLPSLDKVIEEVVATAYELEAFSSGDLEARAAKEIMAAKED